MSDVYHIRIDKSEEDKKMWPIYLEGEGGGHYWVGNIHIDKSQEPKLSISNPREDICFSLDDMIKITEKMKTIEHMHNELFLRYGVKNE